MNIRFYYVKPEYIEHLKESEIEVRHFTCVPNVTYANRDKFFYGAVMERKNGLCYFVPISSQTKNDANSILIKTDDKVNNIKGSLRFAYMIPVPRQMLIPMDFTEIKDQNKRRLLQKELAFCRKNKDRITKQATKTFLSITQATSQKLKNNSCDFELLEKACVVFCIKNNLPVPGSTHNDIGNNSVLKANPCNLKTTNKTQKQPTLSASSPSSSAQGHKKTR